MTLERFSQSPARLGDLPGNRRFVLPRDPPDLRERQLHHIVAAQAQPVFWGQNLDRDLQSGDEQVHQPAASPLLAR